MTPPIKPENRHRYPSDWPVIARRIKDERAGWRCECDGRCGRNEHPELIGRCHARHGEPAPVSGKPVVITVAHLDHDPEHSTDDNLLAMCQACHLAYDADHYAETRARTLAARRQTDSVETELPGLGIDLP